MSSEEEREDCSCDDVMDGLLYLESVMGALVMKEDTNDRKAARIIAVNDDSGAILIFVVVAVR